MIRRIRSLIITIVARWKDLSQKEIGAKAGMDQGLVSYHLRKGDMDEETYERLLAGVQGRPAEIAIATEWAEGLAALEEAQDLTPEERDEIEMAVLEVSRQARAVLTDAVRHSRALPPLDEYPKPEYLEPLRWLAGEQWALLKPLNEGQQLAVVRLGREYQHWALMERVCEESVAEASRDLKKAASLARLAQEIAERVQGPEWWCNRGKGYAVGHAANVLRVTGKLREARATFTSAKRVWEAGADPEEVLDPGRILTIEAALNRAQRRFDEALALLDQAIAFSRSRSLALVQKGFTLEVLGEYEQAIESLLRARPEVEQQGDTRTAYMLRFNLAVNYCHVGRYYEALELLQDVRESVHKRGDLTQIPRVIWLEGRIAAGLGHPAEARRLLDEARREFASKEMWADVALALLEIAALLFDEGKASEVRALAHELKGVFEAEGVHREAMAALQLFQEAVECGMASADLSRRILRYLFRARYDHGLRFES